MSRCLSVRAAAGGVLLLLGAAGPMSAAPRSVSAAELRVEVARLRGVVTACAAGGGNACDPATVGEDLRVGDPEHGGYAVHWRGLREALDKSKGVDGGKRGELLREPADGLDRMAAELDGASGSVRDFGRARREAGAVLAQPEFDRGGAPTWWDRLKGRVFGWLIQLFEGVGRVGHAAPWIGPVLEWLFFVGAAVGLLFFLRRNLARQRMRLALGNAAIQESAWDREATDWARMAEEFAARGEWREAVHCLYWAAIVSLEGRKAWRHNPTRTPREYVRLLKPGSAQQRGLRGLTRIFERVWYGLREGRAEEYTEAQALYEGLASGAVERAGGADDALRSGAAVGDGGAA